MTTDEHRAEVRRAVCEAKKSLLAYLIGTAEKTEGAAVWRALFAEMLARVKGEEMPK